MRIMTFYLLIAFTAALIAFIPDMFLYCLCCKKIKPWVFFKVRKIEVKVLGRMKKKSVCKKCCYKFGIKNLRDLEQVERLRRKVKSELFRS